MRQDILDSLHCLRIATRRQCKRLRKSLELACAPDPLVRGDIEKMQADHARLRMLARRLRNLQQVLQES